jgi:hypothetical protein
LYPVCSSIIVSSPGGLPSGVGVGTGSGVGVTPGSGVGSGVGDGNGVGVIGGIIVPPLGSLDSNANRGAIFPLVSTT